MVQGKQRGDALDALTDIIGLLHSACTHCRGVTAQLGPTVDQLAAETRQRTDAQDTAVLRQTVASFASVHRCISHCGWSTVGRPELRRDAAACSRWAAQGRKQVLVDLALLLLDIVPHAAATERVFSMLGWFHGKHRNALSVTSTDMMATTAQHYRRQAPPKPPSTTSKKRKAAEVNDLDSEVEVVEPLTEERQDDEFDIGEHDVDELISALVEGEPAAFMHDCCSMCTYAGVVCVHGDTLLVTRHHWHATM
ncbi:hypothetical protein JKP88DRAFT_245995 [Tribonema minus]|uniref:HAT C-terminal dimerisation domain-containing protein n=1 Tax=Tribonema minus TaxID=303371 RepID=A0A836CE60_9STRA|nr:hypothetical protein JKP88DRAFT_245995 [Tribonema minus]